MSEKTNGKTHGKSNGKSNGHGGLRRAADFDWTELGERIRQWRLARGMNQQQLAEASGLTQSGLYRLEKGQTNPQLTTLQQIASALQCSVRELLCGKCDSDSYFAAVVQRVKRIVESEDDAARQILEGGLNGAELLLERSQQDRLLNGEGAFQSRENRRSLRQ
ncbi:MAG TPA: helix-turn-helix transcriptional regulator [Terriglobales bacterium]|jgi:transcriptional regulator with XRE-family HTH domain|nr:helix-turn-helix transcriptional regulator [Terriglobales bacterium]